MEDDAALPQQQMLRPRRPDEALKIAVTRLRKVGSDVRVREARTLKAKALIKEAKEKRWTGDIKTPEKLLQQAMRLSRDAKRVAALRRSAKRGPVPLPASFPNAKSLLVVRNCRRDPSRATKELLKAAGIKRVYSAAILPNNEESLHLLRLLRDHVFWGAPDDATLDHLFSTRLRFRKRPEEQLVNEGAPAALVVVSTTSVDTKSEARREVLKSRADRDSTLVSDNVTVEQRLGHVGVLCIEDVREAMAKPGKDFEEVKAEMAPFELADILTGVETAGTCFCGRVDINKIIEERKPARLPKWVRRH